jgi:tetratricopeptide (TPR) repeat protein
VHLYINILLCRSFLDKEERSTNNSCMGESFPFIIIGLVLGILVLGTAVLLVLRRKSDGDSENQKKGRKKKTKSQDQILKEANKKLAQNPKDTEALGQIADIYFSTGEWEKSLRTYGLLIDLCSSHPEVEEFKVTLRHALSAMKLKMYEDAYKGFLIARTFNADVFEINYNLGFLEYRRKAYEKAVSFLTTAEKQQPDHFETKKYLGMAFFRIKRYKDAVRLLRRVIDERPDEKEAIYYLAQSYYENAQLDLSAKLFEHLRADQAFGPNAAIMAGSIHLKQKKYEQAQMDFELGLKHSNIPAKTLLELKYRLAASLMNQQEVAAALIHLRDIQKIDPGYKDVSAQIQRNAELSQNENLQTYLMAMDSDFVTLCRRLTDTFFRQAHTKVADIQVRKGEYADILTEVETPSWADVVLYRFVRTTGQVGELMLRDMYGHIKEVKAGRGFCICAGTFSPGAKKFVEARFIDLIDKPVLLKQLSKLPRTL